MLTPSQVILLLKLAVVAVTVLLAGSLLALGRGKYRLHGLINRVFFGLTLATLIGFELLIRVFQREEFDRHFEAHPDLRQILFIHLCFAVPAAVILPIMLFTGLRHQRKMHLRLALLFGILWVGTFVTGVFYLR